MTGRTTMNAKELLQTYLSSIQNAEAAADFQFENVRIWIETPDRVFAEYDARGHVVAQGTPYKQTYASLLVARWPNSRSWDTIRRKGTRL
jgi:ketosteroid isomerase-like protein